CLAVCTAERYTKSFIFESGHVDHLSIHFLNLWDWLGCGASCVMTGRLHIGNILESVSSVVVYGLILADDCIRKPVFQTVPNLFIGFNLVYYKYVVEDF